MAPCSARCQGLPASKAPTGINTHFHWGVSRETRAEVQKNMTMQIGDRVEIIGDCDPELVGRTGTTSPRVPDIYDGDLILHRVKFDVPVLDRYGMVKSDTFADTALRPLT